MTNMVEFRTYDVSSGEQTQFETVTLPMSRALANMYQIPVIMMTTMVNERLGIR
jgi:hypothetical protein